MNEEVTEAPTISGAYHTFVQHGARKKIHPKTFLDHFELSLLLSGLPQKKNLLMRDLLRMCDSGENQAISISFADAVAQWFFKQNPPQEPNVRAWKYNKPVKFNIGV